MFAGYNFKMDCTNRSWLGAIDHLVISGALRATLLGTILLPTSAIAQISPDETLGEERSQISAREVRGQTAELIEGGAIRGSNLFHSFREFNVGDRQRVYFANPAGVENILSRITGNDISDIMGTLGVDGAANLFLLNPNGIVFGQNARLDVSGSFVASTADQFEFSDGSEFGATNPQTLPLLTIHTPIGLQFGAQPGAIINQGNLAVAPGQSLALIGGQVDLDSGRLGAPGGRIELGGVAATGAVEFINQGDRIESVFPDHLARANVLLANGSVIDVRASDGGSIAIHAQNLNLSEGSQLQAGIAAGAGVASNQAGNITLDTTGAINLQQSSRVDNNVNLSSLGNSGDILITTGSLLISTGSRLRALTQGRGNAGDIIINARSSVVFDRDDVLTGAFSTVEPGAIGQGGDIRITARSLSVTNGAQLQTLTRGTGNAGDITINARDSASFRGSTRDGVFASTASSNVQATGRGEGGSIYITTNSLLLSDGGQLDTGTRGEGRAGNIIIDAQDTVRFSGTSSSGNFTSGAFSSVAETGTGQGGSIRIEANSISILNSAQLVTLARGQGDAGDIRINSNSLTVSGGSQLNSSTFGQADAGNIVINARNSVRFDGEDQDNYSAAYSDVEETAAGQGGNITIYANSLFVTDGAELATDTAGFGNAGNITINVRDRVSFAGGDAFSNIAETGRGRGGNIRITTDSLSVTEGSQLVTSTLGQGHAGSVTINARDRVTLNGTSGDYPSGIISDVRDTARGHGGDIRISAASLALRNGAQLDASTSGRGNAGDIVIIARDRVTFSGSETAVLSAAQETAVGQGGDILIHTGLLSVTRGARLYSLTRSQGDSGNIVIDARDAVVFNGSSRNGTVSAAFSTVEQSARGQGGNIFLSTESLVLTNGAQLQTLTRGSGNAGNLIINARDAVAFDGVSRDQSYPSAAFSSTVEASSGQGGDIRIDTSSLSVTNGALLSAGSNGSGNAGNIEIHSGSVNLDRGQIRTSALSGDGGNIALQGMDSLLLRHNSLISTEAGTGERGGGGNGGDIAINSGLFVAPASEDSDVIANAFDGRGGNVQINTQGIFGIEFREAATLESDITASSRFGIAGEVEITTPEINPSQGIIELPTTVVDASNQIAQTCVADRGSADTSAFVITGRGGLPPSPTDLPTTEGVITEWVTLDSENMRVSSIHPAVPSPPNPIVEAQGWIVGAQDEVILLAIAPAVTLHATAIAQPGCH